MSPTTLFMLLPLLFVVGILPGRAEEHSRFVVAHWHIPMLYSAGQSARSQSADDIRAALELGIDGFAINAFGGKQAKDTIAAFIAAAESINAPNFKVFLSADMSLGFSASDIVATISTFGDNPHYLRIGGKPLLSTYGGGNLGNDWWKERVLAPLAASGHPVTFVPYFDRPSPNSDPPDYENWVRVLNTYPSVDGLFNFLLPKSTPFYEGDGNGGFREWSSLVAGENLARALHDSGKIYMAQYMPYYWAACHSARQYVEYQGGRGMDSAWTSLITKQRPELVQLVTWNDFSESTYLQPTRNPNTKHHKIKSMPHLGYFELLKFYVSWYQTGCKPYIAKDGFFFFHRTHAKDVIAGDDGAACSLGPIVSSQQWGNIKDVIYVTTALTAPALVVVRIGDTMTTHKVPAGMATIDVPFVPGVPFLELWRDGRRLLSISGHEISKKPDVLNFNVFSGYAIAAGSNSEKWNPSDRWREGQVADWFSQDATCLADTNRR